MTQIYIIRHAETVGNIEKRLTGRCDYELTEKGEESIQRLAKRFEKIHIDKLYSSPSKRAVKTILPIAMQKGINIIEEEQLYEMYFGIYDGWQWEEVNKVNPRIHELHEQTNEIMEIPKQETTQEVAQRMYNCIKRIATENKNKTIIIASHGVAIEAFLREVTKEPFIQKREDYSQHNTSVNKLLFDEDKKCFTLTYLNDISHLNGERILKDENAIN